MYQDRLSVSPGAQSHHALVAAKTETTATGWLQGGRSVADNCDDKEMWFSYCSVIVRIRIKQLHVLMYCTPEKFLVW